MRRTNTVDPRHDPVRAAAVGLLALALAACADDPNVPPVEGSLTLEVVTDELEAPVYLTSPPDDPARLFVLERAGRVRVIHDGELLAEPFLDLGALTTTDGERGLLGIAFHPDYAANGFVFVHYTNPDGDTRVVRYTAASPDVADPASALTVLEAVQPFSNHNGGQIAFGPDGMLYVGLGDGGSGGDPEGNGQDPSTLLGSILRLDVDGATPYAIPADNPFASGESGAPEVWAYGLRNPWRFSFDRTTGDLWIGDVGQGDFEEISHQAASTPGGVNFGWNVLEGTSCFAAEGCDRTGLTDPVYVYDHDEGCSVTGGYVYRGAALPRLEGRYLFGDLCSGFVRSFRLEGGSATDLVDHTPDLEAIDALVSFGEDAAGELYVLDMAGVVYRFVPTG